MLSNVLTIWRLGSNCLAELLRYSSALCILSTDPEHVLRALIEAAHLEGGILSSAAALPDHPQSLTLLHQVAGDWSATIVLGWVPAQAYPVLACFLYLQVTGLTWFVWKG